jgi:hypothetical protein
MNIGRSASGPFSDLPSMPGDVGSRGQTGSALGPVATSQFDPTRTIAQLDRGVILLPVC